MKNAIQTFTSSKIRPLDPERAETVAVRLPANVNLPAGQVLEEVTTAATSEVQTLTINGSPTGGTFILGFPSASGYDTTPAIAYNATAAVVQAALETVVGAGNVAVTGSAGGPWTVTYQSELANQDIAQPTLITNNLTGGTSPTVAIGTTTPGACDSYFKAYSGGNARLVLESNTRTDYAGRIADQFGSRTIMTAVAYSRGTFLGSDLVGVDATAVPSTGAPGPLGKLVQGATFASSDAIIRVG